MARLIATQARPRTLHAALILKNTRIAPRVGLLLVIAVCVCAQTLIRRQQADHPQPAAETSTEGGVSVTPLPIPNVVAPVLIQTPPPFQLVADVPRRWDPTLRAARRNRARRGTSHARNHSKSPTESTGMPTPAGRPQPAAAGTTPKAATPDAAKGVHAAAKSPGAATGNSDSKLVKQGVTAAETRREKLDKIITEYVQKKELQTGIAQSGKFPFQRPARGLTDGNGWHIPLKNPTPAQKHRRQRLQQTLDFYYGKLLNTRDDSPWSMMHHMIAWSIDSRILVGGPGGRNVNTIGWLCANGRCEGERLLFVKNDILMARTGPGLQGHQGQFLAMLAQARVGPSQRIVVGDYEKTVVDLILQEQKTCRPRSELSFKLIGLVHYLHTSSTWQDDRNSQWDFPRLIREEVTQPINGTTCGGTHRLMGLTYAVRRRVQDGLPVNGDWARARDFAIDYQNRAFRMQNRDGSFSSDFWRSAGSWGDANRKLKTTGHILEWLVFSLPQERLHDPQLTRATDYLINMLARNRYFNWDKGPLGHGIRALALYNERVYGQRIGTRTLELAQRQTKDGAGTPARKSH